MKSKDKQVIAVYTQRYLNKSMTFVYRQILAVTEEFEVIVLTSNKIDNQVLFPFDKVFSREISLLGRIYRIYKKLTGHFVAISSSQKYYFEVLLKKYNVKLIHAHFGPSGIEILPVAKKLGIPLVVTFHGYDASRLLNNKNYISELKLLFNYAWIICVSHYMQSQLDLKDLKNDKTQVIYYGIDVEKFQYVNRKPLHKKFLDGDEIIFLQISNFAEKKGHIYSLKAYSKFLKYYDKSKLILGGTGELMEDMKNLAFILGIRNKVEFIGRVNPDEVFYFMKNADVFLHHSVTAKSGDQEGIPNVIMEAMATGLTVISSFHAGISELIQNELNGFLVPEKNTDHYILTIKKAVESNNDVSQLAVKTIESDFNFSKQSKKMIELYKKIISAGQ